MKIQLEGKRAIVTGANSGLGRAIAQALGEAGARVVIDYLTDPGAADEVAASVRANGGEAVTFEADVSDPRQVEKLFERIDAEWGGIDLLVNNAGVDGERQLTWESDPESWRRTIGVDLVGPYLCAREALRRMVPQGSGVIVNVTSVHEVIPWTGYGAYTAAKAGLGMLTKTMAQEASPHGVRVLAIAPGAIRTPINRDVWSNEETMADLLTKIPLKRLGTPEEIGAMVVLLASDAASYLTGSTVFVDGAMTTYPAFSHGG